MRILFSCHIWLERSIFLVSSKTKRIMISSFLQWDICDLLCKHQSVRKSQIFWFLFEMASRHLRNTNSVDIQYELIELRQSYEVLCQKMNKILNQIPTSPIQSHRSRQAKFCKEYDSNDYHSTSLGSTSETTIVRPSSMDSFFFQTYL